MIKRLLAPLYERYRHISDTKKAKETYSLTEIISIFEQNNVHSGEKIRIRISHFSEATWNTLKTFVEALLSDERFDVLIIISTSNEFQKIQVDSVGADYILFDDYSIQEDKPDILVISHNMDNTFDAYQREFVKLVVVLSISLIHYYDSIYDYISIVDGKYGKLKPDIYIYDRSMYNELKRVDAYPGKLVCLGNPKYDGIYKASQTKRQDRTWNKLSGKKVVLWATDHGVQYGVTAPDFSYREYAESVFAYFAQNQDMGLIFRPHPTFLQEMAKLNYWEDADLNRLKRLIRESKNVIWDDSDSYDKAYSLCDAIITDCHCGIICSALPTLKPIGLLYKNNDVEPINDELESCQYAIYEKEDLYCFFENIKKDIDVKKVLRKKICEESVMFFDGKNGQRVKDYVAQEYYARFGGKNE